jgi:hypothetical protein
MVETMKKISFVILFAGVMLWGCGNGPKSGDTVKPIESDLVENFDSESSAKITFDEEMHDFGNLSAGENVSYSFHFRNTGKKDLIITGCSASCGCTVPSYPQGRIAPGKDGYLTVSFNSSGKAGETYEEVTVVSNAQPGRQTLRIRAQVGF